MVTRWRARVARHDAERGMTLTELLVTSVILVAMVPLAAGLLEGSVQTERDVRAVTDAGTAAQLVVASVESGVRNAANLRRTTSGTDGADELLVARTSTGPTDAGSWLCTAWFYSAERDVLYTRRAPAASTTTPVTAPTATTLDGWTVLAERVEPRSASAGVLAATANRSRVDLDFTVATGTARPPVTMSTSIVRRPQSDARGAPCF